MEGTAAAMCPLPNPNANGPYPHAPSASYPKNEEHPLKILLKYHMGQCSFDFD